MVALVVGQMLLEQVDVLVDGLGQPQVLDQQVRQAEAAAGDGVVPAGHFVVDVRGREHGLGLVLSLPAGQSSFDLALVSGQLLLCGVIHSKRLLCVYCRIHSQRRSRRGKDRRFEGFSARNPSTYYIRTRWIKD